VAQERRRRASRTTTIIAALVILAASLVGYGIFDSQRPRNFVVPSAVTADRDGLVIGDGPVTVDIFLDFLCPHCRDFDNATHDIIRDYLDEGRIQLVLHPLNILDRASTTDYSTRAAAAAACASDEGRLLEFSRVLFENQPPEGGAGLSDSELIELGAQVGLVSDSFADAVTDGRYWEWVDYVTEQAAKDGVRGTPTVFVNGTPIQPSREALITAVDTAS